MEVGSKNKNFENLECWGTKYKFRWNKVNFSYITFNGPTEQDIIKNNLSTFRTINCEDINKIILSLKISTVPIAIVKDSRNFC